jgi:hypothetical protein
MPTWSEVKEHARSKYEIADEKADSFKLVFEYQNKRYQAIIVSRFSALDREWCDFSSACCRADQMPPDEALKRNFGFAVGGLCVDGEVYVFRYAVQLGTMDMNEFEVPLHVVASTADKLEQEFGGGDDF